MGVHAAFRRLPFDCSALRCFADGLSSWDAGFAANTLGGSGGGRRPGVGRHRNL